MFSYSRAWSNAVSAWKSCRDVMSLSWNASTLSVLVVCLVSCWRMNSWSACMLNLSDGVDQSLQYKSSISCCGNNVELSTIRNFFTLQPKDMKRFELWYEESTIKDPYYCAYRTCGRYIPSHNVRIDECLCAECGRETCRHCQRKIHPEICKQNKTLSDLLDLKDKNGWAQCPRCSRMVERVSGCRRMVCRCGQPFCYVCSCSLNQREPRCECPANIWNRMQHP